MTWTILLRNLVQLPDGRSFDIETKEGANAFLQGIADNDYFSSKLKAISKTRRQKKQLLTANDKDRMKQIHFAIKSLSQHADPKLFRELVPHSEIQCWLDFVTNEIKLMSKKKSWIRTGDLDDLDESVLESIIRMFDMHAVPVAFAFEGEIFSVLADLVKVRKGMGCAIPAQRISGIITYIAFAALQSSMISFDNQWSAEKAFRKMEATGFLEQLLRCMTVPEIVSSEVLTQILNNLQTSAIFLRKKFKSVEPCGDTLKAIVEGKDGSNVQIPWVIQRLKSVHALLEGMESSRLCTKKKICSNCAKKLGEVFQKNLYNRCRRCKVIYYCSKNCQKADWAKHKRFCKPAKEVRYYAQNVAILSNWENQHRVQLATEMFKACDKYKLQMKDMVTEIDFMPRRDGTAPPALRNPPVFKIAPRENYLNHSEKPDWLYKQDDPEKYEEIIRYTVDWLRTKECVVTDAGACFVWFPDGSSSLFPGTARYAARGDAST